MGRIHKKETHGEKEVQITREITFLESFTDQQTNLHLKAIGITDDQIELAIEAAQKIFDDLGAKVFISKFHIEEWPVAITEKCKCGSVCVGWKCIPFERCSKLPSGEVICTRGHSRECSDIACNPCPN